jgi:hypothetical protein
MHASADNQLQQRRGGSGHGFTLVAMVTAVATVI